jgi:hypothetical protein
MEAATPLPLTQVRVLGDRVHVDGLVVHDQNTVELVREHDDAAGLIADAVVIGARILNREQTGADVEALRKDLERTSSELTAAMQANTERVAGDLSARVEALFGPDSGEVTKVLAKHFSDESSAAVQHRVKAAIEEVMVKSRDELRRQFSSASGDNPLAIFQKAAIESINAAAQRSQGQLGDMTQKLEAMKLEIADLRSEKDKLTEIAAIEDLGTQTGRTYEERVAEALDTIAAARGDACEAVGDAPGAAGKKGDVVVSVDACAGPARGRIVFEAKDERNLSRNKALSYLDASLEGRDADYAVLVVPAERLPAKTQSLREFNGDKLFVAHDPDDGSLALEVAYGLARARVLMRRGDAAGIDADALRAEVERAQQALEDVRRIKSQLTGATTGIEEARKILEAMAGAVRGHLAHIDTLLGAAGADPE